MPHLARYAGELFVVQRTPSSVDVRANEPIDPDWFESIATPGWQTRWLENFAGNVGMGGASEDWVKDGWINRTGLTSGDKLYWWLTGTDQMLHQLSYLVIAGFIAA